MIISVGITIRSTEGSTSTYNTPGTYSLSIPPTGVKSYVTVSMWGAGGAGTGIGNWANPSAMLYPGGSGAYVSCSIDATNGIDLYLIVGQGGQVGNYGKSTATAIGGGGMNTSALLQNYYCLPTNRIYIS